MVKILPLPYNLSEAVHRCKIEEHQMANLVIRKIHTPAFSTTKAKHANKTTKKVAKLKRDRACRSHINATFNTYEKPLNNKGVFSLRKNPLDP